MRHKSCTGLFIGLILVVSTAAAQLTEETRLARSLGDDGYRLMKEIGVKPALEVFSRTSSPYRHGDTYVYVLDKAGNVRAHPYPGAGGSNMLAVKDANGIPFIREIIYRSVEETNGFWAQYVWLRPSDGRLWRKVVWVRPAGDLILVSGAYTERYKRQ